REQLLREARLSHARRSPQRGQRRACGDELVGLSELALSAVETPGGAHGTTLADAISSRLRATANAPPHGPARRFGRTFEEETSMNRGITLLPALVLALCASGCFGLLAPRSSRATTPRANVAPRPVAPAVSSQPAAGVLTSTESARFPS